MEFPDESKFNRIRDALWKRSPSASIMVGAGFSKNAEMLQSSASPSPSWRELMEAMCNELYPHDGRYRASAIAAVGETSGALRLAQEYETAFGRTDLHSFLHAHVQDDRMKPGKMHRRLLRLPWRDVFTTNWDTLLERTHSEFPERSYTILRNADEIPLAVTPRIIKLHGSLDGHFPITITEEDYRTYPGVAAPFVNTVQQSMMESVFCLLGFSGDDPNFLHWSGWVRDNLKNSAPKIYLVGWLELSDHRRAMLEARNVVPIDLARHPEVMSCPRDRRHECATKLFLNSLEDARPYEAGDWPDPTEDSTSSPAPFFEPVQRVLGDRPKKGPSGLSSTSVRRPMSAKEEVSAAQEFVEVWSHNRRKTYPGWLAAPSTVRTKMLSTIRDADGIVDALAKLAPTERLNAVREILWLRHIQMVPLSVVEPTSAKLEQEAQNVLECIDCVKQTVEGKHLPEADWPRVRESWIEVGFALVRASRLRFDKEEFDLRFATIMPFRKENHEVQHRVLHEQCLWAMYSLDYAKLESLLTVWDVETADPVWMMRKSALLFELGMDEKAAKLNLAATERARQGSGNDEDIGMLSREAWAMCCAGATLNHKEYWQARRERWRRWEKLTSVKCNIPLEIRRYAEEVRGETKDERGRPFDFGHFRREGISLSNAKYNCWVASHRIIHLSELVGLPPRVGVSTVAAGLFRSAARQLVQHEAELSAWLILRAAGNGSDDSLDVVLSRTNVAVMPPDSVARLVRTCFGAIDYIVPRIGGARTARHWPERLGVFMEAGSRFLLRLEAGDACEVFDKVIGWYGNNLISRDTILADPMRNLLSRSWESLSIEQRREKVVEVLRAPIVGLDRLAARTTGVPGAVDPYPDPCAVLDGHPLPEVVRVPESDNLWRDIAGLLIRGLRTGGEARRRAARRVDRLVQLKVLTETEFADLAGAIWEESGHVIGELPSGMDFPDWVFIDLPEPTPELAEQRFREKWLDPSALDGPNAKPAHSILREVGDAISGLGARGLCLSLSAQELSHLAEVVDRWVAEPIPISFRSATDVFPMLFDNPEENFRRAIVGLQYILLKVQISVQCGDALFEKLNELNKTRMPVGRLSAGLIRNMPGRLEEVLQALRTALVSDNVEVAHDAAAGLLSWVDAIGNGDKQLPPVPIDLVQEIGVIVSTRRKAGLLQALRLAKLIVGKGSEEQKNALGNHVVHGLGFLHTELSYETCADDVRDDLPELRQACVDLAISMSGSDWGQETAVVRWIKNVDDDPLPEVRRLRDKLL